MVKIRCYIKAIVPGCVIFLFLLFTGAVLMKFTSFPEEWSKIYSVFALSAACFIAGIITGIMTENRGMVKGIFVSVIIIIMVYFFSGFILDKTVNITPILDCINLIPAACGMLGGILGINCKK